MRGVFGIFETRRGMEMENGLKVGVSGLQMVAIRPFKFKQYRFEPRDDMTPVEAAYCALLFAQIREIQDMEMFFCWDKISRHFVELDG